MVDYYIWPWFERFPILAAMFSCDPVEPFPHLQKWTERMKTDPAVMATELSPELHAGYFASFAAGKPNQDYGLDMAAKLWHWSWSKMTTILQTIFVKGVSRNMYILLNRICLEYVPRSSIDDFAPNRRQDIIIWINSDLVHWRIIHSISIAPTSPWWVNYTVLGYIFI